MIERDGQTRLWWETTPLDLFVNTTEFHEQLADRARVEWFDGAEVPFLSCSDLAVFKAFFNRTKDWADLEEMIAAGTLDVDRLVGRADPVPRAGRRPDRAPALAGLTGSRARPRPQPRSDCAHRGHYDRDSHSRARIR